jgi:hypothetical protein
VTLIRRVLTSFREDEQSDAQMFQKDDGSFWLRDANGTETQVGSGSGGAQDVAAFDCALALALPSRTSLFQETVIPVDAVTLTYGNFQQVVTNPALVYASGAVLTYDVGFNIAAIDTRASAYTITIKIILTNEDGTEQIILEGSATAGASTLGDTAIIVRADLSATGSTGADLSYNPATGIISSAAGGTYAVMVFFNGGWD